MSKQITYYVIATGTDCDGYNSGHIVCFIRYKKAVKYARSSNEWSDGLQYGIVGKKRAQEYCDEHNLHNSLLIYEGEKRIKRKH